MNTTILTSLITSLIVSLLTFTLGMRAGKNQADRSKLKEIYRKLVVYFNTHRDRIVTDNPVRWDIGSSNNANWELHPLVHEMVTEGAIYDIPSPLAEQITKLEKEVLQYGSIWGKAFHSTQYTISEVQKTKKPLIEKIEKLSETLKKRTEDPHPFWETVQNAFRDVFR